MLAKKLSVQLSKDIIDKFERKELKSGRITIDQNQEKELATYGIKRIILDINELNDGKHAVGIKGDFIKKWQIIIININVDFYRFSERNYKFLITEIRNVLGHEIEHASNIKTNPSIPTSVPSSNDTKNSLMECVYDNRDYLLNESEINAYVREFMVRAKRSGSVLERLLEELIWNKILECNPIEINRHINNKTEVGTEIKAIIEQINAAYRIRIGQIYPNRKEYDA